MKLLILVFSIFMFFELNGTSDEGCPPYMEILQCFCMSNGNISVSCSNIKDATELAVITEYFSEFQVYTFRIHNSLFTTFPRELFKKFQIEEFYIIDSIILRLDGDHAETTFQGLEESLKNFFIVRSFGMSSWSWDILKYLNSLTHLLVSRTDLDRIINDFPPIKSLLTLDLSYNHIKFIHKTAFKDLLNLEYFSLYSNNIDSIDRQLLPNPATNLEAIDFSYNNIEIIPDNFFTNMPELKHVYMRSNKIQFLSPDIFKPLEIKPFTVFLEGNDIFCCLDHIYIAKAKYKDELNITCNHPRSLRGKLMQRLNLLDFTNC